MEIIVYIVSGLIVLAGASFVLIGGVGVLRMPDIFTRLHPAGITDTMGAGLVLLGLAVYSGFSLEAFKLLIILLFLLFSSPVSSFALARAALHGGQVPLTFDRPERSDP